MKKSRTSALRFLQHAINSQLDSTATRGVDLGEGDRSPKYVADGSQILMSSQLAAACYAYAFRAHGAVYYLTAPIILNWAYTIKLGRVGSRSLRIITSLALGLESRTLQWTDAATTTTIG